jgi:hypothetical protein
MLFFLHATAKNGSPLTEDLAFNLTSVDNGDDRILECQWCLSATFALESTA